MKKTATTITVAATTASIMIASLLFLVNRRKKKERIKTEDIDIAALPNEIIYDMIKRLRNKNIIFDNGARYSCIKPLRITKDNGQRIVKISAINVKTRKPEIINLSDYEIAYLNYNDIEKDNI